MFTKSFLSFIIFLILAGQGVAAGTTNFGDIVIREDTIWSGKIIVSGVVVVGRGATLTIVPGTEIRFIKIDRNHDGIGDGEVRVLGRILARGSKTAPIVFASAETNPTPGDWSYLLIFTSGDHNTVQFCRFEDGFSGLQVQFSNALVTDSVFINNNEGIRFGRAKLTIAHNAFTNNRIAIRFTRMEGPTEIKNNTITDNDVGIFLVPSGQNIRDFFKPGRGGTAWNKGYLRIIHNNISHNSRYHLKLGAKQLWDLDVSKNWWGTTNIGEIQEKIYDRQEDQELGRAIIQPISATGHNDTGPRSFSF